MGYISGYMLAGATAVDVTIRGRGGHGAYPQSTLDPIVMAAQYILAIQTIVSREITPTDPAVVTVGSIHGGTKYNIIPDEVELQLTIRTYKDEVRRHILDSLARMAKGIALAGGVPEDRAPMVKVDLSWEQQLGILGLLLLMSKRAAAVTGGGFITLAARCHRFTPSRSQVLPLCSVSIDSCPRRAQSRI